MREIKFRGMQYYGPWSYGSLIIVGENDVRIYEPGEQREQHRVNPETIGQFTGLRDKNGREIYEGDVLEVLFTDWPSKAESDPQTLDEYKESLSHRFAVRYSDDLAAFVMEGEADKYGDSYPNSIRCGKHGYIKVIGNIHENPELLK